jgi:hypothetical protein
VSITDSQLHWNGSTGAHARDTGATYTAVWRLTTDNGLEQAQTIINWFRANVVELGDPYSYAADTGATEALAERIRARRYLKGRFVWEVQVDYAPPSEESGVDEDGNPEPNPLNWRPKIFVNTVQYQRLVEESTFLGGFNGLAATLLPNDTKTMPCNSAMIPYEPALERDDSRTTVRIVRNFLAWDGDEAEDVCDTVNASEFSFNYQGFTMTCEERTAKIREWGAGLRSVNGIEFWESEMVLDRDKRGWAVEVADRGFHARAIAGDPDGRGGSISAADLIPGVPKVRRLVDNDETPISTPVLLDGNGQPLDVSYPPVKAVYGKWLHYEEYEHQEIKQLTGLVI